MDRRAFVISAAAAVLPWRIASAQSGWRTFEVTTRAEVDFAEGVSRVWLPLPLGRGHRVASQPRQRVVGQRAACRSRARRQVRA